MFTLVYGLVRCDKNLERMEVHGHFIQFSRKVIGLAQILLLPYFYVILYDAPFFITGLMIYIGPHALKLTFIEAKLRPFFFNKLY